MKCLPIRSLTLVSILVSATAMVAIARGQSDAPLAEQTFKNVQILRGIPVDEFMGHNVIGR